MNNISLLKPILAIVGSALLATGCVVHEHVSNPNPPVTVVDSVSASDAVYVNSGPPAPIIERVPIVPSPGYVWIGGAWYWQGRWVWHAGRWGRPPQFGAVWIGPHYGFRGGRYVWYRGYWR